MVIKLDKKDVKILSILDWNAKMPLTQIAKHTGLNKDVVRYRIANLEKEEVIDRYYTLININKLGLMTIRIYFDFVGINKKIESKIINYLDKRFGAGQIFILNGEYDLGIISWETSVYDIDKKLRAFKKLYGNYVNKEALSIFIKLSHYSRKIFENSKEIVSLKKEEVIDLKETDFKILFELSKNARISSTDLSVKLRIPQTTVINVIKRLEKERIILGYRANIDIGKIGYENYFLEIYTDRGKEIEEIENYAKNHKNCIYTDLVFPGADIEIETEFNNKNELLVFIDELKTKFKSIKKIKYWSTLKYLKNNYLPEIKSKL